MDIALEHLPPTRPRHAREGDIRSSAGEQILRRTIDLPVGPQRLQQSWRGRHESFFSALAGRDAELVAVAVDVGHFEMGGFAES